MLVDVSVLDSRDRPVTNLSQDQFHILDNGGEQPIRFFAHEDAPVSLAVILDTSGSMTGKWDRTRNMLAGFCENLAAGDELFLVTVERRPNLLADYTSNCTEMQNLLLLTQPHGSTALLDAIPLAVQHLRHAHHARHAILSFPMAAKTPAAPPSAVSAAWRERPTRKSTRPPWDSKLVSRARRGPAKPRAPNC